jgi:O-antigen/teichoic acid export membrane protein
MTSNLEGEEPIPHAMDPPSDQGRGSGDDPSEATRRHLRGSALLLAGRLLAIALNVFPHILIIRHLSKADFGAFAFASSLTTYAVTLASLGMGTAAARFVPIYEERGERERLLGTIVLMAVSMLGMGLAILAVVVGFRGLLGGEFGETSLTLLLILVVLVPVGAIDHLLGSLMAVAANARAIFLRRYLLAPGLKLASVLLVILTEGDVYLLGFAHLATGCLAMLVYAAYVYRVATERGWTQSLRFRDLRFPSRAIFRFALPVLGSDTSLMLRGAMLIVFLESMDGSSSVAEYRAVLPLAELNKVVMRNFGLMFTPLAARILVREDRARMDALYWRNAAWIAILTFPVFAVCFSLARPLTVFLLEDRYASSAIVLAVLSAAYYFHAMLGPNAATLRVFGRVRVVLAIDVLTTLLAVAGYAVLIPRLGALGAAVSMAGSVVLHNLLIQIALWQGSRIGGVRWPFLRLYGMAAAAALALYWVQKAWDPPLILGLGLAAGLSLLMLRLHRDLLDVEDTFPELFRIPALRWMLGSTRR